MGGCRVGSRTRLFGSVVVAAALHRVGASTAATAAQTPRCPASAPYPSIARAHFSVRQARTTPSPPVPPRTPPPPISQNAARTPLRLPPRSSAGKGPRYPPSPSHPLAPHRTLPASPPVGAALGAPPRPTNRPPPPLH